jgi:hypothetical protein
VRNYAGNIADAFTGLLGRTADGTLNNANLDNLQVCDAELDRYKEFVVAGIDFIGASNWKQYTNPLDRQAILGDLIDSFNYRSKAAVVTSYQTTFSVVGNLWGDFSRYAATKGIQYDFASAWKQIIPDALNAQVTSTRATFPGYLNPEIQYWSSATAARLYSPAVIAATLKTYNDWKTNINTLISLPVSKMTA